MEKTGFAFGKWVITTNYYCDHLRMQESGDISKNLPQKVRRKLGSTQTLFLTDNWPMVKVNAKSFM